MNKVLVIYNRIPEELFAIPFDMNDEDFEKAKKCHNKFVDSDAMTDEMNWLMDKCEEESDRISCGDQEIMITDANTSIIIFSLFL